MSQLTSEHTIFWFRRDLRLKDNHGLYRALKESGNVAAIFIFDKHILDDLPKADERVSFIFKQLQEIKKSLEELGSTLHIFHSTPISVFSELNFKAVYANHDYEPYATERDSEIKQLVESRGRSFHTFKDQVIFEKDEVVKDDGTPYVVYTPYSKRWRSQFSKTSLEPYPSEELLSKLARLKAVKSPDLQSMEFREGSANIPSDQVDEKIVSVYDKNRDYPAIRGTTRVSIHLRFGTVSIRELMKTAVSLNETWWKELIWREFYMTILWHFPHIVEQSFRKEYDRIPWINDEDDFEKWCNGMTGYPLVDAGMRELNETGFMHNRVRMVVASFLTKHLLIDWRWGERYFAEKLLDFELSSNNGGWQWAAGSGCDAAPYFRVFNPESQMKKFDPKMEYVKKWVPEFGTSKYPEPMVEHKFARNRAISTYQKVLKKD